MEPRREVTRNRSVERPAARPKEPVSRPRDARSRSRSHSRERERERRPSQKVGSSVYH